MNESDWQEDDFKWIEYSPKWKMMNTKIQILSLEWISESTSIKCVYSDYNKRAKINRSQREILSCSAF